MLPIWLWVLWQILKIWWVSLRFMLHLSHVFSSNFQVQDLNVLEEVLRMVLEILNSCLSHQLVYCPNLVYTLLYKREIFTNFRSHSGFQDIIQNIDMVSSFCIFFAPVFSFCAPSFLLPYCSLFFPLFPLPFRPFLLFFLIHLNCLSWLELMIEFPYLLQVVGFFSSRLQRVQDQRGELGVHEVVEVISKGASQWSSDRLRVSSEFSSYFWIFLILM